MIIENLDFLIYAYEYNNIDDFHTFIEDFKYGGSFEKYAKTLCEKIKSDTKLLNSFDSFLFVPSGDKKRTNFSLKLAKYLEKDLNKPLIDIVKKIKETKELKTLPIESRHIEIKNSFRSCSNQDMRICIVDDVCVSGATLSEMSKTLKGSGASYICAATVAVLKNMLK